MQTLSELIAIAERTIMDAIEVHSIVLLDSVYEGHTLVVTRDVLGQPIGTKTTENDKISSVLEFGPAVPVKDWRSAQRIHHTRPESYSHLGTLRRGGFSVL